jgi:dipeptidase E
LRIIHDNNLIEPIRKKVLSGTKYIGWSAGSNLACPSIKTTNDMPIVDPLGFDALNLIPFQINPHYLDKNPEGHGGETREDRILEFLEVNKKTTVTGLREGCMFIIENNKLGFIGKLPLRVFCYGKKPYEVKPDEDFNFLLV